MRVRYRMPAEWEPHAATWLAWPHETTDWPGKFQPIAWVYGEMARHLSRVERVRLIVPDQTARRHATRVFEKSGVDMSAVEFHVIPTDRSWTRDFCPIFLRGEDGRVVAGNWKFNGWAKYPNHQRDDAVADLVARRLKMDSFRRDVVLEGGSIEVNGEGAMLATEECLLSPVQARNPGMTREQLEDEFRTWLGVSKVSWLNRGIAGDDTHGHVDDLARFVNPATVVTVVESNKADENYEPLRENLLRLRKMPFRVHTLPMPEPVWFDGQRLPASYANFYLANGIALVPVFNDSNDRVALNTLAKLLPDRTVIPVYCRDLVLGLGTLHCATQQEPAPATSR